MLNFSKKFTLFTFILIILTIILFIASFFMPKECSFENHFLENLEVVVLLIGFIIALSKTLYTKLYDCIKFYIAFSIIFFLMAMRELSWGRVFYPIGINDNGEEIFIKVQELWYFDILYPLIAILVIIALGIIGYFYHQCTIKGIYWNIPLIEVIFFIIMSLLSQCVFDRGLIDYIDIYNQNLEECSELLAYIALLRICYKIDFTRHYIRINYFKMWFSVKRWGNIDR